MSAIREETKVIIKLAEYTLKYDEKTEGLRDKTYSELIKEHGHGSIKCACMNRVYQLSSQFVKNKFCTIIFDQIEIAKTSETIFGSG